MDIQARVRFARILAGLTAAQLAERLGIARTSVVRLELDKKLTDRQIERMAAATGIPASFYRGQGFRGLVVARPGRFLGEKAREKAYKSLDDLLPLVTFGVNCKEFSSGERSALLLYNEAYCLVVLPADNVTLAPKIRRETVGARRKVIDEAYESDAGIPALLNLAKLDRFRPEVQKELVVQLKIGTKNERGVVDELMACVERLRREGHDVAVAIKSGDTVA